MRTAPVAARAINPALFRNVRRSQVLSLMSLPFSPTTGNVRSLNQLVRPLQQRRRDREPEGGGGREIDDELELCGLFERHVYRLSNRQDPVVEVCCAPLYRAV